METLTTTAARFLFGIPLIIFGILHFISGTDMEGFMPDPGALFWVYLSGVALVLAGISILVNKFGKQACLLFALMLLIFTISTHAMGILNPDTMLIEIVNTLKNLLIIGGALACAGIFVNEKNKQNNLTPKI